MNSRKKFIANPVTALKHTITATVIILCVIGIVFHKELSLSAIISFTPDNVLLAVGVMLLIFAVKSVTIVVYIKILYVAAGIMFPLPLALAVNIAGTAIAMTLPYLIGRFCMKDSVNVVRRKYPHLEKLHELRTNNSFMFALLLRSMALLPTDPVSMYLGASGMPFVPYMLGGLAGFIPSMVVTTVLGVSAEDPRSPAFITAIALFVLFTVAAALGYYIWQKRSSEKS